MLTTKRIASVFLLCAALLGTLAGCDATTPDGSTADTTTTTQINTTAPTVPTTTLPQQTEPATTAPVATEPEITADLLVGSWYYDVYWGDCMDLKLYTFCNDGTFSCEYKMLLPTKEKTELYTYNTFWNKTYSKPGYAGTYCILEGKLCLSYEICNEFADEPIIYSYSETYSIAMTDGVLAMTDAETGETEHFMPGAWPSKDAVAPELELSPLSGSWTGMTGGGNSYSINRFTFYSNGAFCTLHSSRQYDCPIETNEWGWYVPGKSYVYECGYFTIEGDQLVLTFCYNEYEDYEDYSVTYTILALEEEHFILDDKYGTYIDGEIINYDSVEEMAALFGLEYNPQKSEDN